MAPEKRDSKETIKLKPITDADTVKVAKPTATGTDISVDDATIKVPRPEINANKQTVKLTPSSQVQDTPLGKQTIKLTKASQTQQAPAVGKQTIKLSPNKTVTEDTDATIKVPRPEMSGGKETIKLKSTSAKRPVTGTSALGKETIRLVPNKKQEPKVVDPASKTVQLKGAKASAKTVSLKQKQSAPPSASDPTINLDASELADNIDDDINLDNIEENKVENGDKKDSPLDLILSVLNLAASGALVFLIMDHWKVLFE